MYLAIIKCVTAVILSNFSCHYLCNRSSSDIGVFGYVGVLKLKEHSPEAWHIPTRTTCRYICMYIYIYIYIYIYMQVKLSVLFNNAVICSVHMML